MKWLQRPNIETTDAMSGNMFQSASSIQLTNTNKLMSESRIPVPASPVLLRRHNSLRLKGEVGFHPHIATISKEINSKNKINEEKQQSQNGHQQALNATAGGNRVTLSSHHHHHQNRQCDEKPPLRRGNSFMERSNNSAGYGGDHGGKLSTSTQRPNSVKISGKGLLGGRKNDSGIVVHSPQSPGRIRSLSLSLSNTRLNSPKSPSLTVPSQGTHRNYSSTHLDCWDNESVVSVGSSVASCEHAAIARNGTTFSGRSMKYVFHCNQNAASSGDEYLTPTQRAYRQVKKLKYLLHQAKKDLEQKDSDILKLTKEVVELRLYKAALNSPEEKSNSSDAVTVKENSSVETTPEDVVDMPMAAIRISNEMSRSFSDSGHFEDGTNSSINSNDDFIRSPFKSKRIETFDKSCSAHLNNGDPSFEQSKLIMEYEKRLQELVRAHEEDTYLMKQKHNDKVEELLQRITEINSRYWELVPEIDAAKERIKDLEQQLEITSKKLEEQENEAKKKCMETYVKESEAATSATKVAGRNTIMEIARQHPHRISVPELLNELQVTKNELDNIKDVEYASSSKHSQPLLSAKEALSLWVLGARKAMYRQLMEAKSKNKIDPEITLQFLKSAVYYFLTDKENHQGHLKAIQSILGFTPTEIANIEKARLS